MTPGETLALVWLLSAHWLLEGLWPAARGRLLGRALVYFTASALVLAPALNSGVVVALFGLSAVRGLVDRIALDAPTTLPAAAARVTIPPALILLTW